MKTFYCTCEGKPSLFFESTSCNACARTVGITDEYAQVQPFDWDETIGCYTLNGNNQKTYIKCQNYETHGVCNGMVEVNFTDKNVKNTNLCFACKFNETIPNLEVAEHLPLWRKMEAAKRRALYTLNALGLPLKSKVLNPETGLCFDFIVDSNVKDHFTSALPNHDPVFTGHDSGEITINLAEADDVARAKTKVDMNERYRTLLGHFRHELGHYFFDELIAHDPVKHDHCKTVFGDDGISYQDALDRHYTNGAPANWPENYISEYATMHPWEDWAETWAHYLHILDTLETAQHFGVSLNQSTNQQSIEKIDELQLPQSVGYFSFQTSFDEILSSWMSFSVLLNSLNRSMGLEDAYPFVLSEPVRKKLKFIHYAVHNQLGSLT